MLYARCSVAKEQSKWQQECDKTEEQRKIGTDECIFMFGNSFFRRPTMVQCFMLIILKQ